MQEDLCFALWRPSTGAKRTSAIVFEILLPAPDERTLHGGASFEPSYLTRAVRLAMRSGAGLAFMHNHFTGGWQDMSVPDVIAERDRISPAARATGFPLVGLTLGTDQSWSARFWIWDGDTFNRNWCKKVRVVGRRFQVTFKDRPVSQQHRLLFRTVDTWGDECQRDISGLHFGIVGVGSVGCVIAEALARMGVEQLTIIDPDRIEAHNLDRLLYASQEDIGCLKVDLVSRHAKRSATATKFKIITYSSPIQNEQTLAAALDCDILFSAVDLPLPKDLLNHIAFAHCIPVVSGGIFIDNKPNGTLGQAAWGVTTVGPMFRCLRCDGQYTSSDVVLEVDGSLDKPAYIRHLAETGQIPRNQNVFPFSANLATSMVIEMIRLVIADTWWPDRAGRQHYSMIPNRLDVKSLKCNEHCSVKEKAVLGDDFKYPFLQATTHQDPTSESVIKRFLGKCECFLIRLLSFRRDR
ncbi:MAG: ThiF family adenylyltransferase [Gammaproteobacteria bacterium]|nr:ThiF family adenylyltransferase [Gammaproteobacteria bacterium]